jgi:type I restriction enzyme M protein
MPRTKPKKFIHALSEDLLKAFSNLQLIDKYDVYQHLMTYWTDTMQDDVYMIVADTWKAGNEVEWTKKEFEGKLIPKSLIINRYFALEAQDIASLEAERDAIAAQIEELEEEHSGENGFFADLDKVNKASVNTELKLVKTQYIASPGDTELLEKKKSFEQYLQLTEQLSEANRKLKEAKAELDKKLLAKYPALAEAEIKELVVSDKWIATIEHTVKNEMQRISQRLTGRIKELAERYETTLPAINYEVLQLEKSVLNHLAKMGFALSFENK